MNSLVEEFFKAYSQQRMWTVYTDRIPKEMLDGPINDSGWVPWKLTEGKLPHKDYEQIETDFDIKLPESFITWHRAYFFLDADCSLVRLPVSLPAEPLNEIRKLLESYSELLEEGLIAFGSDGNDSGPLVFDVRLASNSNEYPIKVYDQYAGELSEVIFSSFSKLLECITHFLTIKDRKNFEIIGDFYLIDPEGAGTREGKAYWNSWAGMLKANYEEFGY